MWSNFWVIPDHDQNNNKKVSLNKNEENRKKNVVIRVIRNWRWLDWPVKLFLWKIFLCRDNKKIIVTVLSTVYQTKIPGKSWWLPRKLFSSSHFSFLRVSVLVFWHTRFPMCRLKLVLNIIFMLNWHCKGSSVQVWFDIYQGDLNTNVGEHLLLANIFLVSFITLILVISYHFYLNTKTSLI